MKAFFVVFAALSATFIADEALAARVHQLPAYGHGHHGNQYHDAQYAFGYQVNDGYQALHFGHQERRGGPKTDGSYQVLLPDGRIQTVKYYVDGYNGYVADVSYSHHAKPYHN